MLSQIQNELETISAQYPNWDSEIAQYLSNNSTQNSAPAPALLDFFSSMLARIVDLSKENELSTNDVLALFSKYACCSFMSDHLQKKMRTYYNLKALRDLARIDIYKAKYCVDLIWSSYILRVDPQLTFDETVPLSKDDFQTASAQLYGFTHFCIDRRLCFSAIATELRENMKFTEALSDYIATKIDNSFNDLQLNFIVRRMFSLEETLNKLTNYINVESTENA